MGEEQKFIKGLERKANSVAKKNAKKLASTALKPSNPKRKSKADQKAEDMGTAIGVLILGAAAVSALISKAKK